MMTFHAGFLFITKVGVGGGGGGDALYAKYAGDHVGALETTAD